MGSRGLQSARAGHCQEVDVLIGVAMWPAVLSPMNERVTVHFSGNQLGSVLMYPAKVAVSSAPSVALLKGCRTDPVALRTWMVSEISNDITIAFGCRITFPLQSRCATISILTPWLVVTVYFVRKNPIPDDGVRVELVGNVRFGVKPPG